MKCIAALFMLISLCSCRAVQDVGYARLQLQNGQVDLAEETLISLTNDGYLEAKLALADLYRQTENAEKLSLAGRYYKELMPYSDRAARRYLKWLMQMSRLDSGYRNKAYQALWQRQHDHQDVLPELAQFYTLHEGFFADQELQDVIQKMLADKKNNMLVVARVLNSIDHPERYAKTIAELCSANTESGVQHLCTQLSCKLTAINNDPDKIQLLLSKLENTYSPSDHEPQSHLSPETEATLYSCASTFLQGKYGPIKVLTGLNILKIGTKSSNKLFLLAAKYEYKNKILMNDDELLDGLQILAKQKNTEALWILGQMYAMGYRVIDDPDKAENLLKPISANPKAALALGRLYLTGKLGIAKLQSGVDLLLFAARHGRYRGYKDLSQAFNGWPGIKRNNIFSWIFAQMALNTTDSLSSDEKFIQQIQNLEKSFVSPAEAQKLLFHEQDKLQITLAKKTSAAIN